MSLRGFGDKLIINHPRQPQPSVARRQTKGDRGKKGDAQLNHFLRVGAEKRDGLPSSPASRAFVISASSRAVTPSFLTAASRRRSTWKSPAPAPDPTRPAAPPTRPDAAPFRDNRA